MKVRLISSDSTTDLTQGTDYNVSDRVVTLTNPTSLKIQIYRETTTKPLVGWADASVLRAADMTVQSTQLLHLSEETMDKVQDGGLAQDTNDGVWDARYNRIKNLLDPKEPGDAVTLSYIVANQTSLLTALRTTGKEQNDSIVSTGNTQNTRLTTTGDTQNKRLTDTGNSYVSTMTTLKNTATTKATEASNSAELSKKWAMSSTSPDGVTGNKSSKTWAEEAKSSASASATSATNSANSATASAGSATKAATSEANAKSSETNAKASETAAKSSQTAAKTSETNAAASAKAAAQSEANAKTWDPTQYVTKEAAHQLARNKSYAVGDIAYSPNLPSYLYLECTTAGTTGNTEPDMSAIKSGGVTVSDGTVKFSVKTVCAREYVDIIKNDVGTVKQIPISSYNNIFNVSCYQCGRIVFLSFSIAQITWHNQPFSTNHLFIPERTLPKPVKAMDIEAITHRQSPGIRLYFSTDGNLGPNYAEAYTNTQGNECEVHITYLTND